MEGQRVPGWCVKQGLDLYRELNLNSSTISSSLAASQNTQEDCIRGLSLYHFLKCVLSRIKQSVRWRKGWITGIAIIGAIVAQAHTVKGWMGHSWRRSWENCTLDFSLLSEFVYMWKTLHCFPTEEICNSEFYYFWADSSGIVLKSLLFLIQLIDGFLFSFNCNEPTVFCWFNCPHSLSCKFSLFWSCHSIFSVCSFFPLQSSFWKFSSCDQLFFFLLTTLWRMGCLHISCIALETDLSLDQTVAGFLTCFFWMCEVNNTGFATTRILLSRTFIWSCGPANWILLSWWGFHCRRIIYEFN